jgi:hypothetical protein
VRIAGQQFVQVPSARFKPGFEVTGSHDGQRREVDTLEALLRPLQCSDPLAQGMWLASTLGLLRRPAVPRGQLPGMVIGDALAGAVERYAPDTDRISDDRITEANGQFVNTATDFGGNQGHRY